MPTRPLEPKIENSSVTVHDIIEAFNFKITPDLRSFEIGSSIQDLLIAFKGYEDGLENRPLFGNGNMDFARILNLLIDKKNIALAPNGEFHDNSHSYADYLELEGYNVSIIFKRDDSVRTGSLKIALYSSRPEYTFLMSWNGENITIDY